MKFLKGILLASCVTVMSMSVMTTCNAAMSGTSDNQATTNQNNTDQSNQSNSNSNSNTSNQSKQQDQTNKSY